MTIDEQNNESDERARRDWHVRCCLARLLQALDAWTEARGAVQEDALLAAWKDYAEASGRWRMGASLRL